MLTGLSKMPSPVAFVILRVCPEESPGEAGSYPPSVLMRQALRAGILRLRLRMTAELRLVDRAEKAERIKSHHEFPFGSEK
jgi:hypothetical protein